MKISLHLANPSWYWDEVLAECWEPPTQEQVEFQLIDAQFDLREALDALWQFGGIEGRAWVREHHHRDATRLDAAS
jgi:hypothetical protein